MSMTRDSYAKEVIRIAEAAFRRDEKVTCPHENCDERLGIVRQHTFSTRSLFCPVHGHIFQEQETEPYSKLDWEAAAKKSQAEAEEYDGSEYDELDGVEDVDAVIDIDD